MTSDRPSLAFIVLNTGMLWLATALAAVALWPIYHTPWLVVVVAGALLVGSAIALCGAALRWKAPVVGLVTLAAFLAVGVPLAVPSQAQSGVLPTVQGLGDLVMGVALGWKQLLTISLPVGTFEALLVPFFTLILLLTVVSLSIALRTRRFAVAVFAPAVLYIAALMFGPLSPRYPVLVTLLLAAALVVWAALQRSFVRRALVRRSLALATTGDDEQASVHHSLSDDTRSPRGRTSAGGVVAGGAVAAVRTALSAVVILALAGGAATAAAFVLAPTGDREVLRNAVVQPFRPADYVSPLSVFRRYWTEPTNTAVLFTVTGLPDGARIRIAALDTYNGVIYSVGDEQTGSASGTFTRVPYEFDQSSVSGDSVTLGVEVGELSGPWVPTVGSLQSVQFEGADVAELQSSFFYNNTSGTAAVVGGLSAGDSYTLTAVDPDQPAADAVAELTPGGAAVPPVSVIPEEVTVAVQRYTADAETSGEKLAAMLDGLRSDGYVSHGVGDEPASRSGHAADRISELLTEQRMIGDAEQYAVTAALMARELGFPARVVFGFAPTGQTAPGQVTAVTGADVSAWIEVNSAEFGWVAIDPNPEARDIPPEVPQDATTIARPETVIDPPAAEPAPSEVQDAPRVQEDEADEPEPSTNVLFAVLQWVGSIAAAIVVVLAPFLAIVLAKVRRRRLRRRAPKNLDRITGAWREFEDAALDHGYRPPSSATRSEVAGVVGGASAAVLAAVTDRAVFAPSEPDRVEADRVWRAVNDLNASLDSEVSRWERIKASVSLASLGGYSGRNRTKRGGERL
ncbi:transglutaminase superfamily protein [Glaciihabitans tibetensis]|uniref:Transglutaminase superfamily protein n=1 Tax=Glaciihabitans tibetensis TaxID=1266600 RepID=A0A2T0VHH7_9MICO|nr:transglutaminaseTgpA domain-containing protein [Glaciihabitans tibetensis]PRY69621.1 transglutaminase superfamily protein [Glaciihabitans tibetensis]